MNLMPASRALEAHPLMTSTPATTAPKALYFTWDFVQRTKHNLSQINTQALFSNDPVAREAYSDCVGRSVLTDIIIHDQSGKANLMFPQSEPLDWGEEIRAKAKELSSGGD